MAVMADGIDIEPVRGAFSRLGLPLTGQMSKRTTRPIRGPLVSKAEASHDGLLRGHRHTMLDDFRYFTDPPRRGFRLRRSCLTGGNMPKIYVSGGPNIRGPTAAAQSP